MKKEMKRDPMLYEESDALNEILFKEYFLLKEYFISKLLAK